MLRTLRDFTIGCLVIVALIGVVVKWPGERSTVITPPVVQISPIKQIDPPAVLEHERQLYKQQKLPTDKPHSDCRRSIDELRFDIQQRSGLEYHAVNYLARQLEELNKRVYAFENVPTVEKIASKVIPGVVHIMCPQWQGSGFVVGPRLIATARHVVEGVTDFVLTTNDGHKIHATRAISFKEHDVGFIWIDDLHCLSEKERELECAKVNHEVKLFVLELAPIKECRIGQTVFAVGSPYGKPNFNFLSSGIVSSLNPEWEEKGGEYGWEVGWTTTTVGHPGNSGCPIFSLDGKVRGVLVGGFSPVLVLAMPVDLFKDRLAEIELMFKMERLRFEGRLTPNEILNLLRNYENRNESNLEDIRRKIEEIEGRISKTEQPKSEPNSVCVVTVEGN